LKEDSREALATRGPSAKDPSPRMTRFPVSFSTPQSQVVLEKLFGYSEEIRSAMLVDRIGNLVSLTSRATGPVNLDFVKEVAAKGTALLGGILRGNETAFGILEWVHLRYRRLHVYCWLVNEGYLVFTSKSQLPDSLLYRIGSSTVLQARYAELWDRGTTAGSALDSQR